MDDYIEKHPHEGEEDKLDRLLGRLKGVKRCGEGWDALCPAHEDLHASLSVKKGDDGNILIHCHAGCYTEQILAAVELSYSDLFLTQRKERETNKRRIKEVYPYTDEQGRLLYQVVRFYPKDFRQRRPDLHKRDAWLWNLQGVKRVLYNLPEVIKAVKRGDLVFLVEGEKDVESLRRCGLVGTTNPGGAKKWRKEYNAHLEKARLVILHDNDPIGLDHAYGVQEDLPHAVIVELPGLPPKGDVSDWLKAGGTAEELLRLADDALTRPPAKEPSPQETPLERPYRALGHRGGTYYFLSQETGQIVGLTPSALKTKQNFFQIAPMVWWEDSYAGNGKGADYVLAASELMQQCHAVGLFDPEQIRGRGAWLDKGRVVVHRGPDLVVAGTPIPLDRFGTEFIYPAYPPLAFDCASPMTPEESGAYYRLCTRLRWSRPVDAALFAGWCAVAPICGVLEWRPHIWVTGASGSGKSFIANSILAPLLGDFPCDVQGSTTEAGIRQRLKCDARPVLFDEAESDTQRDQAAMQRVLELARQASSEGNAVIAKGTASGDAMLFRIRSAFCFLSIGVGVARRADETRVTVLNLHAPNPQFDSERLAMQAAFEGLCDERDCLLTAEYCTRFVARSVASAPTIRKSSVTFKRVIAMHLGSQRLGDQLGTLLAGYWSLLHDEPVTAEQAEKVMLEFSDLREFKPDANETDERRCLQRILEAAVRVNLPDRTEVRTVGELIDEMAPYAPYARGTRPLDRDIVQAHLGRCGLRVEPDGLLVSTNHSGLDTLLANTPWANHKWSQHLRRLPGAEPSRKTVRFAGGQPSKATFIPWSSLDKNVPHRSDEYIDAHGTGACSEPSYSLF